MKKNIITLFAIALSFGAFAQQRDTMFVHTTDQFIHEFPTHKVDSIIFERTQPRMTQPRDTIISVSGVVQNQASVTIALNDTLRLSANVLPVNASNQNLLWFSNRPSIVETMSIREGYIIGRAVGTAEIAAVSGDGGHTAVSIVTVVIPVTGVTLNWHNTLVPIESTIQLSANIQPHNATNRNVTWSSSNTSVATVSSTGVVTGVSLGTTVITVTTQDGNHTATLEVTVVPPLLPSGCNENAPGWGESLGTVTFGSQGHNVVIEGNGIVQIWSGAVTATACQKTDFLDNTEDFERGLGFNADCRSNPDFPGDLFSWCAVIRFADVLCPHPWRVPTEQDFIDLDVAMGGTGNGRRGYVDFVNTNYIARWGGAFGGIERGMGMLLNQSFEGNYWSQTAEIHEGYNGFSLSFSTSGDINPRGYSQWRGAGLTLRCVR